MVRFSHSLVLAPVPRVWFEWALETCWDAVGEHLGSALLPLVDGEPLAPGAHYASDGTVVTLDSWHRHGESSGRVTADDGEVTTTCHARLHSAAAPRSLQVEGGMGDGKKLSTGTGGFTVDFERWWAGGTAVVGRFDHRLARGTFEVGRAAAGDRWQVEVTVTVRGRGLFRPIGGLVLAVARRRLQREFVKGLDRFAIQWDGDVPKYVAMSPEELRALIDAEMTRAGQTS